MEAREKELKFLATEGKVIIPFFQRTYVWEEENWENLLEGLFSKPVSKPEGHFLGSIILKQIPVNSGEPKKLEVVDGQQRLTTLSILIKALYDLFSPELQKTTENVMRQILFSKLYETSSEYFVKIEHSQVDKEAYESVITANLDGKPAIDIKEIDETSHRIKQCYKYFCETLNAKTQKERENLFNKILDSTNKMLVVIDILEGKDDEQAIFDTLNTAGVRLTTAEIIKNALYQKIIEVSNKEDAIKLYKETWEKTFLNNEDTVRYWGTERLTGRLKRDNIEILLHCFGVIKEFFDPDKHALSDLSRLYKEKIKNINSKEDLKNFIKEIIEYANIYREKFPTFDRSFSFSFEDSINRLFHILDELEISTFHPYILYTFNNKEFQNDENSIKEKLAMLEKFIVRRMIAQQTTKNYNKYCKEFIKNPSSITEKLRETTDDDILNGLKRISNKNASLLLFWVELYRRNKDNKYDTKELKFTYSLEHIMPQKWEEHWKNIPEKYKPDGSKMTDEEAKKDRDEKIYWIGNMTLLSSSLNSALKNCTFEKKMEGDKERKGIKGIKAYADLSITKDDIVEPYDTRDKNWDETKIEGRTNKLGNEIKEIWNFQLEENLHENATK